MVVLACNPCPCGRLQRRRRARTVHLPGAAAARLPQQGHRPGRRPGRHRPPPDAAAPGRPGRPARRCRSRRRRSARGSSGRAARQAERYAGESWRLNGHAPGPVLRERWPLPEAGPAAGRRPGLRRQAQPPRRHPGAPARLDGRRPAPASTARASTRSTSRCGCGPASRCWSACWSARRERRPTPTGSPGSRWPAITEPGDLRLLDLVADIGAEAVHARLLDGPRRSARAAGRGGAGARAGRRPPRLGLRFVVPGDDEWPAGARRPARPPSRCRSAGACRSGSGCAGRSGSTSSAARSRSWGRASATTYGTDVAAELAATVGQAGRAIVSGAAFGIDQAAHRGALAVGGPTVAVLACGADRAYPAAHQQLIDHLADRGRRGLRDGPGLGADAGPLPVPQPAHRRAVAPARSWSRRRCAAARSTPPTGPAGSTGA